jgi:hypothetical protein
MATERRGMAWNLRVAAVSGVGLLQADLDRVHECVAVGRKEQALAKPATLIRKRAERLGTLYAPDRDAAEAAAVEEFGLTDEQRKRFVIQEQP